MKKDKLVHIDIAKGIAIILVVIGHASSPFRDFIYLFHVPLFFFLSGYLYKDFYSTQPVTLFFRRLKSLYLPFVAFEVTFLFFRNLFLKVGIYSNNPNLSELKQNLLSLHNIIPTLFNIFTFGTTEQLLVPLWFLTSLFTVQIIFCFISFELSYFKIRQGELIRSLAVICCFIIGVYLSRIGLNLPRLLNTSLVALLFFYSGYIYKKYEKVIPLQFYFSLIALIILYINSLFVDVEMVTNRYSNSGLFIVSALLGIYVTVYLSRFIYLKSNRFSQIFSLIGDKSLYILSLHLLAFKLVHLLQIRIYNYPSYYLGKITGIVSDRPWWILYLCMGIVIPLLMEHLFKKTLYFMKDYIKL